jgi:hypothetical protein
LCARVPLALALAQDKNRAITKFKIRCSKYLYTLVIKDEVRTLRARDAPRRVWSRFRVFWRETAIKRGSSTARPSRLLLLTLVVLRCVSPVARIFGARRRRRTRQRS